MSLADQPSAPAGSSTTPAEPGSARWWAERQDRLGRRRPRADGFTVEQIVEAALHIVDEDGLEALTVRNLAEHLGTGSATLYRHVASRDELLVLLVDRVIGDVRFPTAETTGPDRVMWLATELRRVLMDHPHLVPALRAAPLMGPNAMKGSEHGLASLIDAGFEVSVALPAYLALIDYVLGTVFFDTGRSSPRHLDTTTTDPAALPSAEHPTLLAHLDELRTVPSEEDVFGFGLRAFLDGLEARFLHEARASGATQA